VIAALIADEEAPLEDAIAHAMTRLEGAAKRRRARDETLFAVCGRAWLPALVLGRLGETRSSPRRHAHSISFGAELVRRSNRASSAR